LNDHPSNIANFALLVQHLRQCHKYGTGGFRELANGRIRYYGKMDPAKTPGIMAGRRLVREWDPTTGRTRTWQETLNHDGKVLQVRPQTSGPKNHYMFDKNGYFIKKF
jgi:hypothetical protein